MKRRKRWYMKTAGSQRFGGEIVNFSPVTLNGRRLNDCNAVALTRVVLRRVGGWVGVLVPRCGARPRRDRRERRKGGAAGVAGESQQPRREHRDA